MSAPARLHAEHDDYDLAAIARLGTRPGRSSWVLDLGCRRCTVADRVVADLGWRVHAVDATTLVTGATFDLIVSLDVITCIEDPPSRERMYRNCASMLAPGGVLLVKAQFGVEEDVAAHPQVDDEVERLSQWFHVTVEDPFPPSFNPWPATHFHYLVARAVSA